MSKKFRSLPRIPLNSGYNRLGFRQTQAVLLDGPLEFRPMHVFHAGLICDGTTELTLQDLKTGEHHVFYVPKEPRDKVTFFSRWRCIGYTTTGCRFVMWNPTKIQRDIKRQPGRAY